MGTNRSNPTIRPTVSTEKPTAVRFASGMEVIIVHCCENQFAAALGHAQHVGDLPGEHLDPHTGEEPHEHGRAQEVPDEAELEHARQHQQAPADQRGEAGPRDPLGRVRGRGRRPRARASPAASTAAVAESAPTTRSFDEPSSAKTSVGRMIVYRPVWIGIWAIDVYPMTSGIATAASVTPAITSRPSHERS